MSGRREIKSAVTAASSFPRTLGGWTCMTVIFPQGSDVDGLSADRRSALEGVRERGFLRIRHVPPREALDKRRTAARRQHPPLLARCVLQCVADAYSEP